MKTVHLQIKDYELRISKTGKVYVVLFLESIRNYPKENIFHSITFGNYRSYKPFERKKSVLIWRLAKEKFNVIGIKIKDILKNKKVEKSIIAEIDKKEIYPGYFQETITKIIS